MTKEKEKKESILKSSFFLKLFGIPSICWILLLLWVMFMPDEAGEEPMTWFDFFSGSLFMIFIWFIISFVIALIINEVKKGRPKTKTIKEAQYITKPDEKIVVEPEESKQEAQEQVKEKIKMKSNDKLLYTCESIVDAYEYKKMVKYFPQMYWAYVIWGTLLNLIITSIIAILSRNLVVTLIFFVVYQIYLMILYKVRLEHFAEKSFNSMKKSNMIDSKIHTEFYEDYFIRQGETTAYKFNYADINKSIENDTNFYLKNEKMNKIIIIQKNSCDLELISFIRNKFKDLENHLGDTSSYRENKKPKNTNLIKVLMIILFIATLCCLWGALWSVSLVDQINPQHGFNFTKNTWVFWCWLPIPLSSIILGFVFNNKGLKCTKNIVAGFIIGFLLLIYGSFCLFPTFSEDYSKIDTYRNIIDAELPNNGDLEIQDWGTYFDEDKTEYTIINAYYDKEDVSKLVGSIKNSNNWILSKEIKSELKILIPSQLGSDDDAYFSIYNKTTNQYNTLPEVAGNYEIYAMKYDISDKHLEIHKFQYSYR